MLTAGSIMVRRDARNKGRGSQVGDGGGGNGGGRGGRMGGGGGGGGK